MKYYKEFQEKLERLYAIIDDKDATITRLTKENDSLKGEVERLEKELRILYSSNADMFARLEQAEKELAFNKGELIEKQKYILELERGHREDA